MTPASHLDRRLRQSFKIIFNALVLIVLVFGSLPPSMAQAAGGASPSNGTALLPPETPQFAPTPNVNIGIKPLERVLIGETFNFYLTFDNSSADEGYGPFIDLIFPSNGADGAAGTDVPDGIDFVDAAFKNYTLNSVDLVFPDDDGPDQPGTTGCVSHPFAIDNQGNAVPVCGTTGDTLVVLELPFSSITQGMPQLWINVNARVSVLADVNFPLVILARSGFRYGSDSLNNPATDPAVLNPASSDGAGWPNLEVTPQVIHIEKDYDGPKECPYLLPSFEPVIDETDCPYADLNPVYESVTGPNYPRHYTITVDVANGQTVTDLEVTDYFPNNLAYLGVVSTSPGGGTIVDAPTVGSAANPPDNDLVINFPSVSGSAAIVINFFIPEFDADGNPVINPNTGNAVLTENIASAVGDWDPVDDRDLPEPGNARANGPCPDCAPLHELYLRSIAVQKSIAIVTDTGMPGYSPGDRLKYTLDFQISDYFTFGDLILTDLLTDGQRFDDSGGVYSPVFSVSERNTTITNAPFSYAVYPFGTTPPATPDPGDDLIVDETEIENTPGGGTDGSTTLKFFISTAMTNPPQSELDDILEGGEVGTPDIPATGSVTFYAIIQEDFSDSYPSGDSSVDHGDVLYNSVILTGTVRDNASITTTLGTEDNDSAQKFEIKYGGTTKEVYAVNGNTSFTPAVQPGDTITFRLRQSLPSSDSDDLTLTDFLPLPIFDANEITAFDDLTDPTVPAAGSAKFGPASTLNSVLLTPVLPTISADGTSNSLSFEFGNFDDPGDATTEIDILFTVTTSNDPYVDGALLTNLALGLEDTTNSYLHTYLAADQFTLKEPGISLRKGVVASTNASAIFVPNPPGPVAFNPPGSIPSWSGVIASSDQDPATDLINSNIFDVVGGDFVTFAVVLENLGSSSLGAFDISVKDTLPANLEIPTNGINLQVRRGDGIDVAFTPVGSATTEPSGLFDDGIIFDDESTTQGIAHVHDPSSGTNTIVITYDLEIAPDLEPGSEMINTATLLSYAGTDGGPNHVGVTPTNNVHSDDATVTLLNPAPTVVFGAYTTPTDGEVLDEGPERLVIQFSKEVRSGGSAIPGAADNLSNYLLIQPGQNDSFQTSSCAGGIQTDDELVPISRAVYSNNGGHGPFLATLSFTEPLDFGVYRLLVCGTTSIEDLDGNELNDGARDTPITFTVSRGKMPSTGFAPGKTTVLPIQPADKAYTDQGMWLEIPALGVKRSIVGVPQATEGWNVNWLGNDIGYLQGTAFPTWRGNSVLTGHAYNAEGKAGPFAGLEELWSGQQIIIHAWGQRYIYEVRSTSKWIKPTDTSAISKHEEYPWLTLITCRNYDQKSNAYRYRTVVRAVLIKVEDEQ